MSRFIPFPAFYDRAPIDISYLFEDEKPAGKHGFLKVDGDRFVFEDGTPVRFWGTNLNSGSAFPEKDYAEKLAKRLAAYGCNMVRLHQIDSEWATPSIYQIKKGQRLANTSTYDPEAFDRLDYLMSCLKKEGVYVYLDMLTYRKFKKDDGVASTVFLGNRAAPYSIFDRKLIELQKEYMTVLWEHVNPYTGKKYKDEPQIALTDVCNEVDLFGCFNQKIEVEPYATNFRKMLADWAKENGESVDAENVDLNDNKNEVLFRFKAKIVEDYYTEMIGFMRSLGVRVPCTGPNYSWKWRSRKAAQKVGDFMDSHLNVRFMKWEPGTKYTRDIAPHEMPEWGAMRNVAMRHFGRPFFTSEWDVTFPHRYRAESPVLFAALGMLQNWSGYTIHTYAYTSMLEHMDVLGKEVNAETIGGVGYREGIFSTWNDPAKFGMFYHASIITRREDVHPSPTKKTIRVDKLDCDESNAPGTLTKTGKKAFLASAEYCQLETEYWDGEKEAVPDSEPIVDISKGEVRSDTGEMYRNWKKRYGVIDTAMTKAVYGRLGQVGKVELDGMSVDCTNDYAVIALSSLNNDQTLEHTDAMLLTAVGRVENTDMKLSMAPEETQKHDGYAPYLQLDDLGHAPIVCEVIEAKIRLKTDRRDLVIWAVSAEGVFIGNVPVTYEDDCAVFTLGKKSPSIYYLIQAE